MKKKYHRLRAVERNLIHDLRKGGFTQKAIAAAIGFSQSTVSKELSRNCGKFGYQPYEASRLVRERCRAKKRRGAVVCGSVKTAVEARLRLKHSSDQISSKLALRGIKVSHESIYKHVEKNKKAGGDLWKDLRINGKRRYRRRSKVGCTDKIRNRVNIADRPEEIAQRSRYGACSAIFPERIRF